MPEGRAALPSQLRLHCVDSINHSLELFQHRPLVPSRPLRRILDVLDVVMFEVEGYQDLAFLLQAPGSGTSTISHHQWHEELDEFRKPWTE